MLRQQLNTILGQIEEIVELTSKLALDLTHLILTIQADELEKEVQQTTTSSLTLRKDITQTIPSSINIKFNCSLCPGLYTHKLFHTGITHECRYLRQPVAILDSIPSWCPLPDYINTNKEKE